MIAYLSDQKLIIADGLNLTTVEEIKQFKVITFCLNMAVYRGSSQSASADMICICTDKLRLFFFEADLKTQRFI